jgi:integrase/recombinase XerD
MDTTFDDYAFHPNPLRREDNGDVPLPFPETLADTLDAWRLRGMAAGHSPRTINARSATIGRLARTHDPLTASEDDLTSWMATLRTGSGEPVKRSSQATYRAHLRAFYGWLAETGRREDDPSLRLPSPKPGRGLPHPLTPAEVERVLAVCIDGRAAWTRAYVTLAAFGGLRAHEIAKVRGEDVRGDELLIYGKGGVTSTVPMTPVLARLAETMPASGYWFPTGSATGHVHRCSVSTAIQRAFKRAGVVAVPHSLRHYYCTQVLRATGGDLRTTQRLARHASPATTAIYTQVLDETAARAAAAIPGAA